MEADRVRAIISRLRRGEYLSSGSCGPTNVNVVASRATALVIPSDKCAGCIFSNRCDASNVKDDEKAS